MSVRAEDHDAGGRISGGDGVVTPGRETRPRAEKPDARAIPSTLRELADRAGKPTTSGILADTVEQLKRATNTRERKEASDEIARLLGPSVIQLYQRPTGLDVDAIARALGLVEVTLEKDGEKYLALKEALQKLAASPSPSASPSASPSTSPGASPSASPTGTDLSAPLRTGGPNSPSPSGSPGPSVEPSPSVPPIPPLEPIPEAPQLPTFDPGGAQAPFDPNQVFNPNNLNPNNNNNNNRNKRNRGNRGNRNNVNENGNNGGGEQGQGQGDDDKEDEQQTPPSDGGGGGGPQYQKNEGKLQKVDIPKGQAPPEFKPPEAGPEPTIDAETAKALRGAGPDPKYWERLNNTLDEITGTVTKRGDAAVSAITERAKAFTSILRPPSIPAAGAAGSAGGGEASQNFSGKPNSLGSMLQNLGQQLQKGGGTGGGSGGGSALKRRR